MIKELSHYLPYELKGKLDTGVECELVGISLKDPSHPTLEVRVPGSKSPWIVTSKMFKPILKPLFPTIYEEQEDGKIPWIEYQRRQGFLDLVSWEFKEQEYSKWRSFEGKFRLNDGRESNLYTTATFDDYLAYQVAYEMGIDVYGLIDQGKAISR